MWRLRRPHYFNIATHEHGDYLAEGRLQRRVLFDVHDVELEAQVTQPGGHLLAEVTARAAEQTEAFPRGHATSRADAGAAPPVRSAVAVTPRRARRTGQGPGAS